MPLQYDAFISYRREDPDKTFARDLLLNLERDGYKVAIDERDFRANEPWPNEMERCLKESRFTLAVLSPRFRQSGNCEEELLIQTVLDLTERKRRLIPLIIEQVERPTLIYLVTGIDYTAKNPLVAHYERLKQTLGEPLKRPDSSPLSLTGTTAQEKKSVPHESPPILPSQLMEELASQFNRIASLAAQFIAGRDTSFSESCFVELAAALLSFNATLCDADRTWPRYRICERLERAASSGVRTLEVTAALLLLNPKDEINDVISILGEFQKDQSRRLWPTWLTYILDQLFRSHQPPAQENVIPELRLDDWRKAELAFGCILFSDEVFLELQNNLDAATGEIDHALQSGGFQPLTRPPARVRDLVARFDHRALAWYSSLPQPSLGLLQPPPLIAAISESDPLRHSLDEVWTAANCLQIALDKWADWFRELTQLGDAHPAVALSCDEMARHALKVLSIYRPNLAPFCIDSEQLLLSSLPPIATWWVGTNRVEVVGTQHEQWQKDRKFLDRYYSKPEDRMHKANILRGAAAQLIEQLKSYPRSVLRRVHRID